MLFAGVGSPGWGFGCVCRSRRMLLAGVGSPGRKPGVRRSRTCRLFQRAGNESRVKRIFVAFAMAGALAGVAAPGATAATHRGHDRRLPG